jgi:hypothetical protein
MSLNFKLVNREQLTELYARLDVVREHIDKRLDNPKKDPKDRYRGFIDKDHLETEKMLIKKIAEHLEVLKFGEN